MNKRTLNGDVFRFYKEKCFVYVWWRAGRCLYVGRTTMGISRIIREHHVIDTVAPVLDTDTFDLYECERWELGDLERQFIRVERPEFNKKTGMEKQALDRKVSRFVDKLLAGDYEDKI